MMTAAAIQEWTRAYLTACDMEASSLDIINVRLQRMQDTFEACFGQGEARLLRAPGRVNLIGEHTDYNGYPVMPLAIQRDVLVLFRPTADGSFHIVNTDDRFSERRFTLADATVPFSMGDWGNYVKAAIQGLRSIDKTWTRGFCAVVDGTVPAAAGLASSSSLVVASGKVFLHANDIAMDGMELAEQMARAEHFVGTAGGGMDQAISMMGVKGCAVKIDFFPLRTKPTPLPPGFDVVICHSLIRAPKTESALKDYNRRPMECRIATVLLAHYLEQKTGKQIQANRLADLSGFALTSEEVQHVLGAEPLTLAQVYQRSSLSPTEWSQAMAGRALWEPADGLKLWMRYRHVVEEAGRVTEACQVMAAGDAQALGRLMNASHSSCRDLYEISTPELDALVETARQSGAVGSRLTGAGFGGCVVSLVPSASAAEFMNKIRERYYLGYLQETHAKLVNAEAVAHAQFATRATAGAGLL
jgi:N-acetylgalactosamine kinase